MRLFYRRFRLATIFRAGIFLCGIFLAASLPARAGGVIDVLKEKNAGISSFSCEFVQETRIPLFESPVLSKGRMAFARPDSLRWEYLSPMREGFAVSGAKGLRWREGEVTHDVESVAKDPLLAIISKELMTWVTLDMARITKEYTMTVTAENPPTLSLLPKRPEVAAILRELSIVFEPTGLARSVTIAEQQGGVTVIRFSGAVINGQVTILERP